VLLDQNKLPEAILQLNNAVQADPTQAEPHRLLAEAYTRQGNTVQAAAEAKLAADLAADLGAAQTSDPIPTNPAPTAAAAVTATPQAAPEPR
jgi:predicted Zn-dependent protease